MKPKDERGEPVFSTPNVDEILQATIIEHATEHAQTKTEKTDPDMVYAEELEETSPKSCKKPIDKKSIFKIVLLAVAGMLTVACFLLIGNFYFVKKANKKKQR